MTAPVSAAIVRMRRVAPRRPLLFIDFEASSLSKRSWPIEFGYAWTGGGRVFVRSTLVAPRPEWPLADWAEDAERVHGIALDAVLEARPAVEVAAETEALKAFDIVSDNPHWDRFWLDRLRGAGAGPIEVLSFEQVLCARLGEDGANAASSHLLRTPSRHRAGPDAARLAAAWAAGEERLRVAA